MVKISDPYNEYELMAYILVKATFVFEFSNIGYVLPLQANFVKSKMIFLKKIFIHDQHHNVNSNNFLVGRLSIQILLVLDLQ